LKLEGRNASVDPCGNRKDPGKRYHSPATHTMVVVVVAVAVIKFVEAIALSV